AWWLLVFGPLGLAVSGALPVGVGISGGLAPVAVPPLGWTGSWSPPVDPASPSYRAVTWNPNPYPPATAPSETFIKSGSTFVIPMPTASTTVVFNAATVTLAPGGTPVGGALPPDVTIPGATTPTWSPNIILPTSAKLLTFTAPPAYTSVVAIPTASDPPVNVTGPPGALNSDGDDWWLLKFAPGGPVIAGKLPANVGIVGGITPTPVVPPSWTGAWQDPTSSSTSATPSSCPTATWTYDLPDDPENLDWEDLGTDPDMRRRKVLSRVRWETPRKITVPSCAPVIEAQSPEFVKLSDAKEADGEKLQTSYWSVPQAGTTTNLVLTSVNGRPTGTIQEHVFELGLMRQFFGSLLDEVGCDWIRTNIFEYTRTDGTNMGTSLVGAIDKWANMVWADVPMNQAKSNVVNQNRATPANSPQHEDVDQIDDFNGDATLIQKVEFFARNFAALGQCMYPVVLPETHLRIATEIQTLLSELTPSTPINPSLSTRFSMWLNALVSTYPAGCTSRANNVFNYYRTRMRDVSAQSEMEIPDCFPLVKNGDYNPSTFDWQALIPPPPSLPVCNGPGTEGAMRITDNVGHQFIVNAYPSLDIQPLPSQPGQTVAVLVFRILGSGDPNNFALGTGHTVANDRWLIKDAPVQCSSAPVYLVQFGTPADGDSDTYDMGIGFTCDGPGDFNFDFVHPAHPDTQLSRDCSQCQDVVDAEIILKHGVLELIPLWAKPVSALKVHA
ncbi:hypothetical protein FB451DRAFT_1506423, partial [Mycena latifolia]